MKAALLCHGRAGFVHSFLLKVAMVSPQWFAMHTILRAAQAGTSLFWQRKSHILANWGLQK